MTGAAYTDRRLQEELLCPGPLRHHSHCFRQGATPLQTAKSNRIVISSGPAGQNSPKRHRNPPDVPIAGRGQQVPVQ